jgi:hypothetical protein
MDKCRCLHMHMIKVLEWHGYLETHCLNLQNKWKRWARTSVTIYTRERLRLKRIIHHECPRELSIQEFAFVFKIWKPSKLQKERPALILGNKFWGSIDESDDVSHLESKVCKEIYETSLCSFLDLIARGKQSLAVGVCWRSIMMGFTANAPPDFMKCKP